MEHSLLTQNPGVLTVEKEDDPYTEFIQTLQCLIPPWLLILLQKRIIKNSHNLAGL